MATTIFWTPALSDCQRGYTHLNNLFNGLCGPDNINSHTHVHTHVSSKEASRRRAHTHTRPVCIKLLTSQRLLSGFGMLTGWDQPDYIKCSRRVCKWNLYSRLEKRDNPHNRPCKCKLQFHTRFAYTRRTSFQSICDVTKCRWGSDLSRGRIFRKKICMTEKASSLASDSCTFTI